MWQRIDEGRVHRQDRIEQVREPDAVRFRYEPEKRSVGVEAPRAALLDDLQPGFVVPVEDLVVYSAGGCTVDECERVGAVPLDADDGNRGVQEDAANGRTRLKVFEFHLQASSLRPLAERQYPTPNRKLNLLRRQSAQSAH